MDHELAMISVLVAFLIGVPPPPDPVSPPTNLVAGALVCAGACAAGGVGAAAGLALGPVGIPLAPVLGFAGAAVGGGIAEATLADTATATDGEVIWGLTAGGTGFLVGGVVGAALGHAVGSQLSSAPELGGGFGAIAIGAVGGALGAGVAVAVATVVEPPPCLW